MLRPALLTALLCVLPAPATGVGEAAVPRLPEFGERRESRWIHSEPLSVEDLAGHVVLLDVWTFGCVNCQHVIPSLRAWHDLFADEGLVIIGDHYPEFA